MSKFKLIIELGNDAMKTPNDVANALRKIVYELGGNYSSSFYDEGNIKDENGNTVGLWIYDGVDYEDENWDDMTEEEYCEKYNTYTTEDMKPR